MAAHSARIAGRHGGAIAIHSRTGDRRITVHLVDSARNARYRQRRRGLAALAPGRPRHPLRRAPTAPSHTGVASKRPHTSGRCGLGSGPRQGDQPMNVVTVGTRPSAGYQFRGTALSWERVSLCANTYGLAPLPTTCYSRSRPNSTLIDSLALVIAMILRLICRARRHLLGSRIFPAAITARPDSYLAEAPSSLLSPRLRRFVHQRRSLASRQAITAMLAEGKTHVLCSHQSRDAKHGSSPITKHRFAYPDAECDRDHWYCRRHASRC